MPDVNGKNVNDSSSTSEQSRRISDVVQRNRNLRMPKLPKTLSADEKKYLLAVERGDNATVRRMIQNAHINGGLNINCMDPLGRTALLIAIESEQFSMVELLVVMGVKTSDSLLHAIEQEFVEAVELLLEHEELIHKEGEPYSWESIDRDIATFTPEITPLILAAHKNNYEILKILLDRGATLPMPHDIRCPCDDCLRGVREDSLRHSASRINSYKALASPSLIALTSVDPLLTAFELSWELKQLSFSEKEFRLEYLELRMKSQSFAVDLLSHVRTTHELEVMLNYDPHVMKEDDECSVDEMEFDDTPEGALARLRLAITYKQKKFVAHSWVQQLLAAIWYDGLPGFRQKTTMQKCIDIVRVIVAFPFYCCWYMIAPKSSTGRLLRKPFMKFLIHSSSYLFFLLLLILVSQRVEEQLFDWWESQKNHHLYASGTIYPKVYRGKPPTYLELVVALYILGYILEELRELMKSGLKSYTADLWNSIDFLRNFLYVLVFILRAWAYMQQRFDISMDSQQAYIPREDWEDFDPQLIAEGLFAAANIFSALKLVQISSINPHLGPLQISLGRMVVDILKFFFFYSLVLFAFACGLNQLLWYFADLEKAKCYSLPGGLPDWNKNGEACMKWRRFGNLFESSQSLFWASFGMVSLADFELSGIKSYTRFWGLLMFGSYSVINVIVLLNLLIAMMSNSYATITEKADTEWKFARTKLWLAYFDEDATLPPPFNLFPTFKQIKRILSKLIPKKEQRLAELRQQAQEYTAVMRTLVWRYVSWRQRKSIDAVVTEDDMNEVKTEISSLRYDIFELFRNNGYKVSSNNKRPVALSKKTREWERRLFRNFHVAPAAGDVEMLLKAETDKEEMDEDQENQEKGADRFRRMARLALMNRERLTRPPKHLAHIGKSTSSESFKSRQSLKKAMAEAHRMVVCEKNTASVPSSSSEPSLEPEKDSGNESVSDSRTGSGADMPASTSLSNVAGPSFKSISSSKIFGPKLSTSAEPLSEKKPSVDATTISSEEVLSPVTSEKPSHSKVLKSPSEFKPSETTISMEMDTSPPIPQSNIISDCTLELETEKTKSESPSKFTSPEVVISVSNAEVSPCEAEVSELTQIHVTDESADNNGTKDAVIIEEEKPKDENVANPTTTKSTLGVKLDLPIIGQRVEGVRTIRRPSTGGSWF